MNELTVPTNPAGLIYKDKLEMNENKIPGVLLGYRKERNINYKLKHIIFSNKNETNEK